MECGARRGWPKGECRSTGLDSWCCVGASTPTAASVAGSRCLGSGFAVHCAPDGDLSTPWATLAGSVLENTPNTLVCHGLQNTAASFGGGILAQYALYIATRTRHNGNKAFYGAGALKLYSAAGGLLPARSLRPSCLPAWPVAHRPQRACTAAPCLCLAKAQASCLASCECTSADYPGPAGTHPQGTSRTARSSATTRPTARASRQRRSRIPACPLRPL